MDRAAVARDTEFSECFPRDFRTRVNMDFLESSAKWDGRSRAISACTLVVRKRHAVNVSAAPSRGGMKYETFLPFCCPQIHAVHDLCSRRTSQYPANPGSRSGCLDPVPPGCRHRVEQFVAR